MLDKILFWVYTNSERRGVKTMTSSAIVREKLMAHRQNELIMASRLYKRELLGRVSEDSFYKTIERMCKAKELVKISKGTYYLPKVGKYGVIPPSESEIVSAFTANNRGVVVGYSLYNMLGLTTQIAKSIAVISNSLESVTKTIRNITIQQVNIEYSRQISSMIQALEVLQNYAVIQDLNYSAFIRFAENLALSFNEEVFESVNQIIKYKKVTISFLREILRYYGVKNNLSKYLSSLSEYKHPTMEDIYEAARIHG